MPVAFRERAVPCTARGVPLICAMPVRLKKTQRPLIIKLTLLHVPDQDARSRRGTDRSEASALGLAVTLDLLLPQFRQPVRGRGVQTHHGMARWVLFVRGAVEMPHRKRAVSPALLHVLAQAARATPGTAIQPSSAARAVVQGHLARSLSTISRDWRRAHEPRVSLRATGRVARATPTFRAWGTTAVLHAVADKAV